MIIRSYILTALELNRKQKYHNKYLLDYKSLLDYTNSFSSEKYENNAKIILKYFQ